MLSEDIDFAQFQDNQPKNTIINHDDHNDNITSKNNNSNNQNIVNHLHPTNPQLNNPHDLDNNQNQDYQQQPGNHNINGYNTFIQYHETNENANRQNLVGNTTQHHQISNEKNCSNGENLFFNEDKSISNHNNSHVHEDDHPHCVGLHQVNNKTQGKFIIHEESSIQKDIPDDLKGNHEVVISKQENDENLFSGNRSIVNDKDKIENERIDHGENSTNHGETVNWFDFQNVIQPSDKHDKDLVFDDEEQEEKSPDNNDGQSYVINTKGESNGLTTEEHDTSNSSFHNNKFQFLGKKTAKNDNPDDDFFSELERDNKPRVVITTNTNDNNNQIEAINTNYTETNNNNPSEAQFPTIKIKLVNIEENTVPSLQFDSPVVHLPTAYVDYRSAQKSEEFASDMEMSNVMTGFKNKKSVETIEEIDCDMKSSLKYTTTTTTTGNIWEQSQIKIETIQRKDIDDDFLFDNEQDYQKEAEKDVKITIMNEKEGLKKGIKSNNDDNEVRKELLVRSKESKGDNNNNNLIGFSNDHKLELMMGNEQKVNMVEEGEEKEQENNDDFDDFLESVEGRNNNTDSEKVITTISIEPYSQFAEMHAKMMNNAEDHAKLVHIEDQGKAVNTEDHDGDSGVVDDDDDDGFDDFLDGRDNQQRVSSPQKIQMSNSKKNSDNEDDEFDAFDDFIQPEEANVDKQQQQTYNDNGLSIIKENDNQNQQEVKNESIELETMNFLHKELMSSLGISNQFSGLFPSLMDNTTTIDANPYIKQREILANQAKSGEQYIVSYRESKGLMTKFKPCVNTSKTINGVLNSKKKRYDKAQLQEEIKNNMVDLFKELNTYWDNSESRTALYKILKLENIDEEKPEIDLNQPKISMIRKDELFIHPTRDTSQLGLRNAIQTDGTPTLKSSIATHNNGIETINLATSNTKNTPYNSKQIKNTTDLDDNIRVRQGQKGSTRWKSVDQANYITSSNIRNNNNIHNTSRMLIDIPKALKKPHV